jgi:hypothetical protein
MQGIRWGKCEVKESHAHSKKMNSLSVTPPIYIYVVVLLLYMKNPEDFIIILDYINIARGLLSVS